MGNENSLSQSHASVTDDLDYVFIEKKVHPLYGDIKIFRN